MKKVRDGSRNINAYAETNLSSVRDIRSFFDTGERTGCRLSQGTALISQNALYFMHNLNSLPPFPAKSSYARLFCLFAGWCVRSNPVECWVETALPRLFFSLSSTLPPSTSPPRSHACCHRRCRFQVFKHFPCKSKVLAEMLSHVRAAAGFRAAARWELCLWTMRQQEAYWARLHQLSSTAWRAKTRGRSSCPADHQVILHLEPPGVLCPSKY